MTPKGKPGKSIAAATAAAFAFCLAISGANAASLEYPIKAAYLYKFAPFVEWPALPPSQFSICIAGKDPFGAVLDKGVRDLSVNGRTVKIQRFDTFPAGAACQILYVSATATQSVQQTLDMVQNAPTLTVAEKRDGANSAIIQFVIENDRVRFDIDVDAARAHGLTISSKLLSLARSVRQKRQE